jgi:uncharacterized protein YutE (UPF0331/DUF86 family)
MREYYDFRESLKRLELIHVLGPENLAKFRFLVDVGEQSVGEAVRSLLRMGRQILGEGAPEEDIKVVELLGRKKILPWPQVRKMKKLLSFRKALLEAKAADGEEAISAREVYAAFEKLRRDLMSLGEALRAHLPFEVKETQPI